MNNYLPAFKLSVASALAFSVFVIGLFAQTSQAQDTIPDTVPANRFKQLLQVMNDSEEESRNKLIDEIFNKDDGDLNDIKAIAGQLGIRFGEITFHEVSLSNDTEFFAVCNTKRTGKIVMGVELSEDELIADVTIRPFEEEEEELVPVGDFVPLLVDGKSLKQHQGVWHAKGYGYLLEVTDSELRAYNFTGKFGWQIDFAENLLFKPGESDDTGVVTFHPLEPGYNVTRIESLPEVCRKDDWTPTELFDAFADIMTVHYPFFEERNVDWQKRIATHRPKVSDEMSEKELFDVMDSMLNELNDGHVSLLAEIDGTDYRASVGHKGTMEKLFAAFEAQTEIKSRGIFVNLFMNELVKHIEAEVLNGKANHECNDNLVWGRVNDEIGYIYISSMYGYGNGNMDQQVQSLHLGLNKILTELADTKSLILDVSLNPGGTDAISIEIARHFADQTRVGFSKWPATQKQYRNDRKVVPYSQQSDDAVMYTKPVYLLTNDFSASAAEIFTMCMRAFPHVTTVGTATEGALSDILDKSLPNGWEFGISNEVYVDHEGVCHEGPGVPPEVQLEVFDDDIMNIRHSATIQKVVEIIGGRKK